MLKLPGRGEKGENSISLLSPYKKLFSSVKINIVQRETNKSKILESYSEKNLKGSLIISNIQKRFGRNLVLENINLEIKQGEIFGIIGVSGSGKTTVLRLIMGFYKPTKGEIVFNEKNINQQLKFIKQNFGFATQDNSFYKHLNVEENIRFFGKLYGLTDEYLDENVDKTLQLMDLVDARKTLAENLSGGMQRRLDLACALINEPGVLILDEPTEDLDPHLRNEILHTIKEINKRGTTIIFTTHLLHEVEFLCDRVAIISGGKIITIGSVNDLRNSYKTGEEIHLILEKCEYSKYIKKLEGYKCKIINNKLIVYISRNENAVKVLKKILTFVEKNKDKIVLADIKKPSLNEIFSELTNNVKNKKKPN